MGDLPKGDGNRENAPSNDDDRSRSPMNTTGIQLRKDASPEGARPSTPPNATFSKTNREEPSRTNSSQSISSKLVVGPHHDADAKSTNDGDDTPARERSSSRRVA